MKQLLMLTWLAGSALYVAGQSPAPADAKAIRAVFESQRAAWNAADLPGFMKGYWRSDSLTFVTSKGLIFGWQPTLDRYRASYPDAQTMGYLNFDLLRMTPTGPKSVLVTGKWTLRRERDTVSGYFTVLLRKIKGTWVIVYDHSS